MSAQGSQRRLVCGPTVAAACDDAPATPGACELHSGAVARLAWRDIVIIVAAILLASCWAIGNSPLARTEPHRAMTAHEMNSTGEWVVPTLFGQPYLRKPPLHYWVLAAAEQITGSHAEWVYRAPSAASIALLGGLIAYLSGRWFGRIGGVAAGLSLLAIVPLWSQTRNADVDALNTLLTVATALAIVELGRVRTFASWGWAVLAGLAFGGALLTKGPACLPVVLGTVIATIVVHRRRNLLAIGLALAAGTGLFLAWAWMAVLRLQAAGQPLDKQGVDEVARNLTAFDFASIGKALLLPATIAVYALPVALALPLAWSRAAAPAFSESHRRLIHLIAISVAASLAIGVISRITNPRYMYISLPMLCPLAGAVAWAVVQASDTDRMRLQVQAILKTSAIAFLGLTFGLTAYVAWRTSQITIGLIGPALLGGAVGAWLITTWSSQRPASLAGVCVALLMLATAPYSALHNQTRREIASYGAAQELRRIVGEQRSVCAGDWVLTGPELFLYADVSVDFYRHGLAGVRSLPHDGWVVFHQREWEAWANRRDRFDPVIVLPTRNRNAILAYYHGARDSDVKAAARVDDDMVMKGQTPAADRAPSQ